MCSAAKDKVRWLGHPIKRNTKIAETEIHMQVVYLQALGRDRCKLTMMTNADPHLSGIPSSVINYAVRSGVGEFLKHGINGLTFNAGDPGDLADRILELQSKPELRVHMADSAQQDVLASFDETTIIDQVENYLNGTIEIWSA